MVKVTENDVQKALTQLDVGLSRYLWIQENVHSVNVTTSEEFRRRFTVFYRVRRNREWCNVFYGLLESAKPNGITFDAALNSLHKVTGRVEASFASKLVATLDPSKPVIDRIVLGHFDLRLPPRTTAGRLAKIIKIHGDLSTAYADLLFSPTGRMILARFDQHFYGTNLTPLKKIDLVLWQIRAEDGDAT
jgi:hypothetical protein